MNPEKMKSQVEGLLLFFRPVGSEPTAKTSRLQTLRQQIIQIAVGITSALAILFLSSISLASMAIFTLSCFAILIILDRILGIEIYIPNLKLF